MIAVDANILMEVLEQRRHVKAVREALEQYRGQGEIIAASSLTISHLFYLAESYKLPLDNVEQLVSALKIYDVTAADVSWAIGHYKIY